MENIIIEGRLVTVHNKRLTDDFYIVYKDKIWRIVSKENRNFKQIIGLEREKTKEKIFIKDKEITEIKYIIKPTGYIDI